MYLDCDDLKRFLQHLSNDRTEKIVISSTIANA